MNKKDLKQILIILEKSYKSEDIRDYGEEGGWGPAAGCAAKEAEIFNKELKTLIYKVEKEVNK
jgi:hypothetical protein